MTLDHRQDPVKKLKAGNLPYRATSLSSCNVEWFSCVLLQCRVVQSCTAGN